MNGAFHSMESKANIVEGGSKTNKKRKHNGEGKIGSSKALKKFKRNCYNCGKVGHRFKYCQKPKNVKGQTLQANITENDNISNLVQDMNLFGVVLECNSIGKY
ncbi:CCHC-type domain-containing protein [Abeliophyllum distichum]|uniref:CCHC-type domain-containing protein n=1 Tax=Abeliophyllum distichum TaxID=126358 RepID=A0ABD1RGL9_9LAMI